MSECPQPGVEPGSTCQITVEESAGTTLIALAGDMDYATIARIRAAIDEALLLLGARMLVLDLTEVTFLDSAGISALLDSAAAAMDVSEDHRVLRIVVDHARAVIRPLEIAGLDRVLMLYETRAGALES
ncbi:anti-sigma factor antagonist [Pseudonocardia saturnea]